MTDGEVFSTLKEDYFSEGISSWFLYHEMIEQGDWYQENVTKEIWETFLDWVSQETCQYGYRHLKEECTDEC